eukprot:jgi/Tetstr1/439625/TSEL_028047.t1
MAYASRLAYTLMNDALHPRSTNPSYTTPEDKAVRSDVFDECWPRDTQPGIPYPLKKMQRFHMAAPRTSSGYVTYTTFNYRAGYTADNHVYTKETVMAAFREYTPSPFIPTPLRPSLWVVLTVHLVMYMKQGNWCVMGRPNSKRRIPEGKESWTPATWTWEAAITRVRCDACGASVAKTWFYDKHRWTEACTEPPDTAAPVAAGGDGVPATPQELRILLDADSDADSDAEGIVAGAVDGNPSDDSRGDVDGEGDAIARYDFTTGTNNARGKYGDGKR